MRRWKQLSFQKIASLVQPLCWASGVVWIYKPNVIFGWFRRRREPYLFAFHPSAQNHLLMAESYAMYYSWSTWEHVQWLPSADNCRHEPWRCDHRATIEVTPPIAAYSWKTALELVETFLPVEKISNIRQAFDIIALNRLWQRQLCIEQAVIIDKEIYDDLWSSYHTCW